MKLSAALVAFVLMGLSARSHGSAQPVFRSGIDLVQFGVTVVDRKGSLVTDLKPDDFVVVEEGRKQRIDYFAQGAGTPDEVEAESRRELDPQTQIPLHLGLLFDTSGSMSEDLQMSRTAAIKFLNALPRAEDMTVVDFDTEVRVARYGQADFPRMVERIRNRKPDGWTALYDALGVYLDGSATDTGRKILVIYTDGGDTRSALTFAETLDLVKACDVTIYAIGFLEHQSTVTRTEQRMRLQQIAEATGGQAFFPTSIKQLDEMYAKVLEEMAARYTLGYLSTNPLADGAWREVEIKVQRADLRGARIRTRRGYFAPMAPATRPEP